jgi:hypothetical protein
MNTLAYYNAKLITNLKYFVAQAPAANPIDIWE